MFSSVLSHTARGFTLIELLIAMAIGGLLLGALVNTFVTQRRSYDIQEQVAEMTQSARLAMDFISRELRMAGYNPTNTSFEAVTYNASTLQFRADLDGDSTLDDADETVSYFYDNATQRIMRDANGSQQPLAEHITAFTFDYLDAAGNATTTSADIYQVRVTITAHTSERDPHYGNNNGYRTYTLTSLITPRNVKYNQL